MHSFYGNVVQRRSGSSGFSAQECHIESEDDPPETSNSSKCNNSNSNTSNANSKQSQILETLKAQNESVWKSNTEVPALLNGQIVQTEQRKTSSEYYGMSSNGSDSGLSDSEVANQAVRSAVESPTPTRGSPSTSGECTPSSLSPAPASPTFASSSETKSDLSDSAGTEKNMFSSPSHHPSLPGEKMPMLGKSLSWVNPKLQARVTKTGCGLFCITPIKKNEFLIVWTGKILSAAEALAIMETHEKHYILQIGDGFYQTPLQDEREPADLTNHSCEPTAGFGANSPICLTAFRDMNIGEEVVFDYGMCETDDRLWEPMECACGSQYCRGLITAHDWKREDLWQRYDGWWAPHVQKKINEYKAQKAKEKEQKEKQSETQPSNNETEIAASTTDAPTTTASSSPSFMMLVFDFVLARFLGLKRLSA